MDIKNIIVYGFFVLIASTLFSCTEDTTIDTTVSEPIPVIYGTITDRLSHQEIQVSRSCAYFEKEENKKISEADVTVEEDSIGIKNVYTFSFDSVAGVYKSDLLMAGRPGRTYKLSVSMDFNEDSVAERYEAQSIMPEKLYLDSITITKISMGGHMFYSININAQDPAGIDNYYFSRYSVDDTLYNKISKYIYFDDTSLDGMYVGNLAIANFYDISEREDMNDDDAYDMVFLFPGERFNLEVSNITKGYSYFIEDCQSQKDGSNPLFGGPPANISTNISNGAAGYFAAFSIDSASCIVPYE